MSVWAIIPARLESSRLPRKLLLAQTGMPLLQHTWRAVRAAGCFDRVIIAVDHPELAAAAEGFGAECVMTGEHASGSDRIAHAARLQDQQAEILVNVQGDEPEISTAALTQVVQLLRNNPSAQMATLGCPIRTPAQLANPACVKAVRAADGRALYFTRAPAPHLRDGDIAAQLSQNSSLWLQHIGLYAYRPEFLDAMSNAPPSPLEQIERLEQLRALEMGAEIQIGLIDHAAPGIDTQEDYDAFVRRAGKPPVAD